MILTNICAYLRHWKCNSEHLALKSAACRQNMTSRGSSADSADSALSPGFRGNGPSQAGPDLGSTRAGGKDDGSLHKLPQNIIAQLFG